MEYSGNTDEIPKKLGTYMIPHTVPKYSKNETVQPRSQFLHSCLCGQFIYSHDWFFYFAVLHLRTDFGNINRSQKHECRNWEWGRTVSFAIAIQPLVEEIFDHVSGRRRTTPATLFYSLLVNGRLRKHWWDTQEAWYLYDTPHCTEIFQEMKLCSLVPNFYIPVSVGNLYIPMISPHILLYSLCK